MSLLTRCHLPVYIKILDYVDMNESVLVPSKAYINPKKNNKSDILIEEYFFIYSALLLKKRA